MTLAYSWKRIKIIYQSNCKRWKIEYLAELHRRYKWKFPKANIKLNENNVRVVDIRTAAGIRTRPITKLVVLFHNQIQFTKHILITDMSANLHPTASHWQWSSGLFKQDHTLRTSCKFLNASADERYDVVIMQSYCITCLARSHFVQNCKNEFGRRVCTRQHNTLLNDAPQLQEPKDSKPPLKKLQVTRKSQMTQTIDMPADMDPRSNTMVEIEIRADVYPHIRRDGAIELENGNVICLLWTPKEALLIHTIARGVWRMFRNTLNVNIDKAVFL